MKKTAGGEDFCRQGVNGEVQRASPWKGGFRGKAAGEVKKVLPENKDEYQKGPRPQTSRTTKLLKLAHNTIKKRAV